MLPAQLQDVSEHIDDGNDLVAVGRPRGGDDAILGRLVAAASDAAAATFRRPVNLARLFRHVAEQFEGVFVRCPE